ncbi:MAG: hypothetical protein HY268_06340 [Deltaproteobacteria bacterium]|nr:hypothetical protein [Deltaproteobacteria bacterium]
MAAQEKTFKVECVHCRKPFHVRFPLTRPEAEGKGEVVVTCLYCNHKVVITIPTMYIEPEALVRGLKSAPVGN